MNVIINSVAVFCYLQAINVGIEKKKKKFKECKPKMRKMSYVQSLYCTVPSEV